MSADLEVAVKLAAKHFQDADFVAKVLTNTSLLEEDLDFTLSLFFCGSGQHFTFIEIVSSVINFENKIRILENIPARKNLKSRKQAIAGLRRFQKIRNMVAHPRLIKPSKVRKLCEDVELRRIILNFPEAMNEEFLKVRRSFFHLMRSREWNLREPDKLARLKLGRLIDRFNRGDRF